MPGQNLATGRPDLSRLTWYRSLLTSVHAWIFVGIWLSFCLFNGAVVYSQDSDRSYRWWRTLSAVGLTILGPLPAAAARDYQSCCLNTALQIAAWAGLAPLLAAFFQVLLVPDSGGAPWFRYLLWMIGWLIWFGAVLPAYLHSFS